MSDDTRGNIRVDATSLGTLVKMLNSPRTFDRDVATRAIKDIPPDRITPVLEDGKLPYEALDFFIRHSGDREDWVEALLKNPSLKDEDRALLIASRAVISTDKESAEEEIDEEELNIGQRIARMQIGEKIKLAMKGDKEARTILIKDTNKEVYMSVLNNPGLKESEVEMLTKNTGTSSDILRAISRNREWVASRNIMHSLILNAKTPPEVSIRFLPRLGVKDLERIDKSRGLPAAVRANAKRLLSQKKKGR